MHFNDSNDSLLAQVQKTKHKIKKMDK